MPHTASWLLHLVAAARGLEARTDLWTQCPGSPAQVSTQVSCMQAHKNGFLPAQQKNGLRIDSQRLRNFIMPKAMDSWPNARRS